MWLKTYLLAIESNLLFQKTLSMLDNQLKRHGNNVVSMYV